MTLRVGKEFRSATSQFDFDFDLESDLYQPSSAIFTSGTLHFGAVHRIFVWEEDLKVEDWRLKIED